MTEKLRVAGIKNVIFQVDNAGGHGGGKANSIYTKIFEPMREYVEQTYKERFPDIDVHFIAQPPCSPDMNVLDLGAWYSIQCKVPPIVGKAGLDDNLWVKNILDETEKAWKNWDSVRILGKLFCTLRNVFVQVVKTNGGNTYNLRSQGEEEEREEGGIVFEENEEDDDIVYPAVVWAPNAERVLDENEEDDIVYPAVVWDPDSEQALDDDDEDGARLGLGEPRAVEPAAAAAVVELPEAEAKEQEEMSEFIRSILKLGEMREQQAIDAESAAVAAAGQQAAQAEPAVGDQDENELVSSEAAPVTVQETEGVHYQGHDFIIYREDAQHGIPNAQQEEHQDEENLCDVSLIEPSVDVEEAEIEPTRPPQKRPHTSHNTDIAALFAVFQEPVLKKASPS